MKFLTLLPGLLCLLFSTYPILAQDSNYPEKLPAQAQESFSSFRQKQLEFYQKLNFQTEEQYDSFYIAMNEGLGMKPMEDTDNKVSESEKMEETCTLNRQIYGWHPYWHGSSVFNNYNYSLISTFSYFSYELNPSTGSYNNIHSWKTTNSINLAKAAGSKVELCVTNFGTTNNVTFLTNQTAWVRLADSLIVLLNYRNADGVNIDFEGIPGSQRNNFTAFITYLNTRFSEDRPGTSITMALYAVDWTNVFDIAALNPLVDAFIVMGYDYHYSADVQAGPVSPLYHGTQWGTYTLSRTADYYLNQGASAFKLLMGVPYYGYDWKTNSTAVPSSTVETGVARLYNYLKNNFFGTYTRLWDQHSFSPYFIYTSGGQTRQCWFEDEESLAYRYDMVLNKQMGGIGIWALGYDNGYDELWDLLQEKFTDCSTNSSGIFYDSGGPLGSYRNNENSVFTLASPYPDEPVSIQFNSFDIEANFDYIHIYDGPDISSPLLGSFTGSDSPGTFSSSGNALTIRFTSDGATIRPGFQLEWFYGCFHQTKIQPLAPQYSDNFIVSYLDTDNCPAEVKDAFYQVQQSWGGEWRSNQHLGFFNDDFNTTSVHPEWTSVSGNWQISSGSLYQSNQSINNTNLYSEVIQASTETWLYHWRAKTSGSDGFSRRSGLHFFATEGMSENRGNSYFVFARIDDNKAQIYKVTDDVFELKVNADFNFNPDEWYDYKVSYNPVTGQISFYVNNREAATWTDPTPYTSGQYVSLRTGNSQTFFDFVRVYRKRGNETEITMGNGNLYMVNPTAHECRILSLTNYTDNRWSNLAMAETGISYSVNIENPIFSEAVNTLNIYPNPAKEKIQVVFQAKESGTTPVKIYDFNGRVVWYSQFNYTTGNNFLEISINQLPASIYLLTVETSLGILQQKMVKIF